MLQCNCKPTFATTVLSLVDQSLSWDIHPVLSEFLLPSRQLWSPAVTKGLPPSPCRVEPLFSGSHAFIFHDVFHFAGIHSIIFFGNINYNFLYFDIFFPLYLIGGLAGHRIVWSKSFSLRNVKILFHFLLESNVVDKKSKAILILILQKVTCLFLHWIS